MSALSDFLHLSNTATGAQSAQMQQNSPHTSLVSNFINTLAKYAQPVVQKVESGIQSQANDFANSPIGQLTQGHFGNIIPAAKNEIADLNSGKYKPQLMFGGEMEEVPGMGIDPITGLQKAASPVTAPKINNPAVPSGPEPQFAMNNQPNTPLPKPPAQGLPPIGKTSLESEAPIAAPAAQTVNPMQNGVKTKIPMITQNKADPMQIAKMSLNFDVPRRIAQNQMVKPDTVMNQLLDDDISARNLDELHGIANNITGETGAFPKINNYILDNIKTPIDYRDAIASKTQNLSSVLEGENKGFINQINKEVNQALSPVDYANKPAESGVSTFINPVTHAVEDVPEGHAYASDLFQASQNLQRISRMYLRKAYTDMGELNHPEMERAAQALMDIKNNIDDAIDKNVPPGTYQAFKADPFVQQQLQRVPPAVANRFLSGAERFKDGQTIQAPYVNLSNMIEDTKDTQLSVWTKTAKALQQQNTSGQVANTIKENVPGPKILKNTIGGIVKGITRPFDKTPEDIFQENMNGNGTGTGFRTPGGNATKLVLGGGLAAAAGAGLEALKGSSNANSDIKTDNGNNSHIANVAQASPLVNSQVETDMSKIDPKSPPLDPRSVTGGDGTSLAMDAGKYQTAKAALDALVKQDPSYITNPIKAGQLKAAHDALDTKFQASQKLMDSYQKVATVAQKVADAQSLLDKTHPFVTDKSKILEAGHEMVDPNYQSLINDLNFIESSDPRLKGQLSGLATAGSVKTALANAAKLLLSEHNQLMKSYGAGTEPTPQIPSSTPTGGGISSQLPAGLPAPVNGSLPAMQNGSYQFTPPNPMFQQ